MKTTRRGKGKIAERKDERKDYLEQGHDEKK